MDGTGLAGIERFFEEQLRAGGEPVALSLDLRVQQIVHEELADAHRRFRSIGANAMVLDRVTGELLAMVSLPDFDPNRVSDVGSINYLNRNTGEVYELGLGVQDLDHRCRPGLRPGDLHDRFDATGKLQIGRYRIGDDHAKNRWLSVPEIFEYSSNIGTARLAFAAGGAPLLEEFFGRLGFNRQAGDRARRGGQAARAQALGRHHRGHQLLRPWHRGHAASVPGRGRRPDRGRHAGADDVARARAQGPSCRTPVSSTPAPPS